MALGPRLNQRASLQKARMAVMSKFLQEMAAAEAAYCKSVKKSAERLEAFLQAPEHNPATFGDDAKEPADLHAALACVLASLNGVADEHGTHAARAYNDAAGKLASLTTEYTNGTKGAVTTAVASSKSVEQAEAALEKVNTTAEKAFDVFASSDGAWTGPDPWLSELARQHAADALVDGMRQHQAMLESASKDFTRYESLGRSGFIRTIEEAFARVRQTSERVQSTLSHSYNALREMDCPLDDAYWQQFAKSTVARDTENASAFWHKCSANVLGAPSVEKQGVVSRPGMMKLTWSAYFAVLTRADVLHFFETPPEAPAGELPRLTSLPSASVPLRDCTVVVANNNPSSLCVEVVLHSKLAMSKKYTLKFQTEEETIDWIVALQKHVPTDSVWAQRRQRAETAKNDKFLQKRGACGGNKENKGNQGTTPSDVPEASLSDEVTLMW